MQVAVVVFNMKHILKFRYLFSAYCICQKIKKVLEVTRSDNNDIMDETIKECCWLLHNKLQK